ncbi:MAG: 3-methyl-2-oxobutanoate hydroxymethyltransferase [Opitutales bacterium]
MTLPQRKDLAFLQRCKRERQAISMLTCYDAPTAQLQCEEGVDILFVGDSVAQTVLGYASTAELPLEAMLHHLHAVRRGVAVCRLPEMARPYVLADLPFRASQSLEEAKAAGRALAEAGADGVKFEGPHAPLATALREAGVDAWGHLGYTPQTMARPVLQGRDAEEAEALVRQAHTLAAVGIAGLVVELVPASLGERLSRELKPPVIGIGAGKHTDGQVQVWHDLIGATPEKYRHAWRFAETRDASRTAIRAYLERLKKQMPSIQQAKPAS